MYLSLYCKVSKRVTQGFTVRGSWRPNRTAIYWPPLLWPLALCLSRSPDAQPEAHGPTLLAFSTASYHQLVWSPNSIGGLKGPFCWVVTFPTTTCLQLVCSQTRLIPNSIGGPEGPLRRTVAFSTTTCLRLLWSPTHWLPVFIELYNSSITHSIFGMAYLIVIKRK